MPRPVISVDTIGRLQRIARSHEALADHLSTGEQLELVLDRHVDLLDRLSEHDDVPAPPDDPDDRLIGVSQPDQPVADLGGILAERSR